MGFFPAVVTPNGLLVVRTDNSLLPQREVCLIVAGSVADRSGMRLALAVIVGGILGAAFVFHERRTVLEHELGSAATQLAGRQVHVHCQGLAGDLLDITAEAGTVQFDENGTPADVTNLKRPICNALRRFPHDVRSRAYACVLAQANCPQAIFEDVLAVHTLAHDIEQEAKKTHKRIDEQKRSILCLKAWKNRQIWALIILSILVTYILEHIKWT